MVFLVPISYSRVSNKGSSIDVSLAGTKIRTNRLNRQNALDNTRHIDDNRAIGMSLVVMVDRPEERK